MSDFDSLCKKLEGLDPETFTKIFNEKSVDVLSKLVELSTDGRDALTAYIEFILAAAAADGVMSKQEFALLKPFFDRMADKDLTYEEGVEIFKSLGLDKPEAYKKVIDNMVDIIGLVDDDLKEDIVFLCLLVCAIDGEVSQKEKDWIKQLLEPPRLVSDPIKIIDKFLSEAKVFTLATSVNGQPKMRMLGLKVRLEGRIFFAVGTFKDVYKQLQENPKCEILASVGTDFLRWDGTAAFVEDPRLLPIVDNLMPDIVALYKERGWQFGFFTLRGGSAEIVSVDGTHRRIY
jgi:uncharacterized pyridoxamine 5'-phosphate oxidase family protein